MKTVVPSFAVVGHPNEGKSSVLSTLAEDDSVRISPVPGETSECRAFPVIIDGREILCFTDTPGFQNPRNTLRWMQNYEGPETDMVKEFVRVHKNDPAYRDDCELLTPLLGEAGIIFVVDGSRPVRNVDRAEMEILRMIGRPRMAIINNKEDDTAYLAQWKSEFRKHFNSIRIFNSNRATYGERIALLESLKSIDQDLQGTLEVEEKELFLILKTVSGIGPKLGLAILSGMRVAELFRPLFAKISVVSLPCKGWGKGQPNGSVWS